MSFRNILLIIFKRLPSVQYTTYECCTKLPTQREILRGSVGKYPLSSHLGLFIHSNSIMGMLVWMLYYCVYLAFVFIFYVCVCLGSPAHDKILYHKEKNICPIVNNNISGFGVYFNIELHFVFSGVRK